MSIIKHKEHSSFSPGECCGEQADIWERTKDSGLSCFTYHCNKCWVSFVPVDSEMDKYNDMIYNFEEEL